MYCLLLCRACSSLTTLARDASETERGRWIARGSVSVLSLCSPCADAWGPEQGINLETPISEQQFRKLHHSPCRRSQLPAETQLLCRCCFSAPFHCKAPVAKGEIRALSQRDAWLSSALALGSCRGGFEDLLPHSCTSLALSRGVLSWPRCLATFGTCRACSRVGDITGHVGLVTKSAHGVLGPSS